MNTPPHNTISEKVSASRKQFPEFGIKLLPGAFIEIEAQDWNNLQPRLEAFLRSALESQLEGVRDSMKKVTLTKEQSTKIFAEVLEDYKTLQSGWDYKAPEVIKQEINEFLWNLYIQGRINEKNDLLAVIKK